MSRQQTLDFTSTEIICSSWPQPRNPMSPLPPATSLQDSSFWENSQAAWGGKAAVQAAGEAGAISDHIKAMSYLLFKSFLKDLVPAHLDEVSQQGLTDLLLVILREVSLVHKHTVPVEKVRVRPPESKAHTGLVCMLGTFSKIKSQISQSMKYFKGFHTTTFSKDQSHPKRSYLPPARSQSQTLHDHTRAFLAWNRKVTDHPVFTTHASQSAALYHSNATMLLPSEKRT